MTIKFEEKHWFDPNAFGMATLLGGLFVLGIGANLMLDGTEDELAQIVSYSGLLLIFISIVSFTYSFITLFTHKEEEQSRLLDEKNFKNSYV